MARMTTTRTYALCGSLVAALALSACGGGGSDAGGEAGGSSATRQEAALRFAQCMREQGVPGFPDPDERGGFAIDPESQEGASRATQDRARRACGKYLRAAGPPEDFSEEEQAEGERQLIAFNRCMREHGFDFPDPEVDGGRIAQSLPPGFDRESPRARRAEEACRRFLPGEGGGE